MRAIRGRNGMDSALGQASTNAATAPRSVGDGNTGSDDGTALYGRPGRALGGAGSPHLLLSSESIAAASAAASTACARRCR